MKNIIKAQIYQMKLPAIWKKVLFWMIPCMVLVLYINIGLDDMYEGVAEYFTSGEYTNYLTFVGFFVAIASAEISGNDFQDKTINYEIMSGHSRKNIFFARVLVSVVVSVIGSFLILGLPILLFAGLGKMGTAISLGAIMIRILLTMLPIAKLSCEVILITYIAKNSMLSAAIGCFGTVLIGALGGMANGFMYLFSTSNLMKLFRCDGWSVYRIKDVKEFFVVEPLPSNQVILYTVLTTVIVSAMVLFIGYKFFEKDDLR